MAPKTNMNPVVGEKSTIQIPLTAALANTPDKVERNRTMLGNCLKVESPASATIPAVTAGDVVEAGTRNNLGTPRPSAMLCGLDATNTFLYLMPVKAETPGATVIKYNKGQMMLNLYPTYSRLDRLVPEDYREYYPARPTPAEVTIGTVKGWAIYINLTEFTKEKITRLSDEERAKRLAKLRQTLAKKKAAKQAEQESAPTADGPTEEDE